MAHAAISICFQCTTILIKIMYGMPYGIYEDTSSWFRGNIEGNHS